MLKMTINPSESIYPLPIPADFVGKTIEILLYSRSEVFENKIAKKLKQLC